MKIWKQGLVELREGNVNNKQETDRTRWIKAGKQVPYSSCRKGFLVWALLVWGTAGAAQDVSSGSEE